MLIISTLDLRKPLKPILKNHEFKKNKSVTLSPFREISTGN